MCYDHSHKFSFTNFSYKMELALSLRRSNEQESDVRTFIRELDEGILNRLISRILVGEVKKVDGEKFQKIKIIYNFVGEIPAATE